MPNCKNCQQSFVIDERDQKFYAQIEVPPPTFCPDCRQQRRLSWANETFLYQRKCNLTGKDIISMYRPELNLKVYNIQDWWSDKWDGLSYGCDYDFGQSFFSQFMTLNSVVPHAALNIQYTTVTNSDFVNYSGHLKNCYLIFDSDNCEDCYYSGTITNCRDCVDCMKSNSCELCYQCLDCLSCFNLKYSDNCLKCSESFFLKNCSGCINCFGCVNLRNSNHCYFNEQLTVEEYQRKLKEVNLGNREIVREVWGKLNKLDLKVPHKHLHGIKNDGCTGDYLHNTNATFDSFDCWETDNCRYCYSIPLPAKDLYDVFQWGNNSQLLYESVVVGDGDYNCKFCDRCYENCQNVEYSYSCISCKNCFGCAGLKKKQFCIFNKQYSEKEYQQIKSRIVEKMTADGEYGEFFPARLSPHGYNETDAIFYYPLNKEQALGKGFNWYDRVEKRDNDKNTPNEIMGVNEEILKQAFNCVCGRPLKIIAQELKFYQKQNIPLPDQCYICRHIERLQKRNPQHLWLRKCAKCGQEIQTTYAPERPEIVYCKECFIKEVY